MNNLSNNYSNFADYETAYLSKDDEGVYMIFPRVGYKKIGVYDTDAIYLYTKSGG